jgi:hypothetical protein
LRELVPRAYGIIYETEQRGKFPRRFALSPRCIVWDLAEGEASLASRRSSPVCLAPSVQTSASAAPSRSESRITREERHRRRDAYLAELVAGGAAFRAMTGKEGGSDGVDDAYGQRSKDS